eukprot:comp19967_c0_seq1/m.24336 comp19967_c0_seq1/g.24336  ORF comp19967_c0_seq1/g.24336 comp19967_c0_seq1/m.24336 type:complete len:102 (-) comp19967_c0_seq1:326-631(-)
MAFCALVSTGTVLLRRAPSVAAPATRLLSHSSSVKPEANPVPADLMAVLACPLTKKPLRWDPKEQALVSDDVNVAYPVVNGLPNLNPHTARLLKDTKSQQA